MLKKKKTEASLRAQPRLIYKEADMQIQHPAGQRHHMAAHKSKPAFTS